MRTTTGIAVFMTLLVTRSAVAQNHSDRNLPDRVASLEGAVAKLEAAVASLQSTIDGLAADIATLTAAIKNEVSARIQGDYDTSNAARDTANQLDEARLTDAKAYTDWALARRLVFVTSTPMPSNLGGLEGADRVCQQHASRAGLPGTYKAWLSDTSGQPYFRLTHSHGDYTLVDGTLIAHGWQDLTDGALNAPISLDESGHPSGAAFVWTNTNSGGGGIGGGHCSNWSSGDEGDALGRNVPVGSSQLSGAGWTHATEASCGAGGGVARRLYCFQQ